ncbi:hypothetical protein Tco_0760347 [Tanacetum coccineum]
MQRGKVKDVIAEMLCSLDQIMERKEGGGADKTYYDLKDMYGGHVWGRILLPISWWKIYFKALVDIAEGIENTAKTCVRLIILKRIDKDTHLPLTEFSIIIVIIRVFNVLYLKRCMEGSVGHMFFGLKLEKFGRLD